MLATIRDIYEVHCIPIQEYTELLEEFLDFYQEESDRLPIIIWRETTAQHHKGRVAGELTEDEENFAIEYNL